MAVIEASKRLKALRALLKQSGAADMFGAAGKGKEALAAGTPLALLLETAYVIVAADEKVTQGEYDQLVTLVSTLTDGALDGEAVEAGINSMMDRVDRTGARVHPTAIASALGDATQRRTAFLVAAGISYADGRMQREEQEAFRRLATAFEIGDPEAEALLVRARDMLAASNAAG